MKYHEKYCGELEVHMGSGFSFQSFAGKIGVCRSTLYDWIGRHEGFRLAKDISESASLYWWEKKGIEGMRGEISGFNATTWIFNMKNRHG